MKLRLVLQTKTDSGADYVLKFNIAPSKHIGFVNFLNLALNQQNPVKLTFEKETKSGKREESKIFGKFKLQTEEETEVKELQEEIKEEERQKKKQKKHR
ncbi:MAG: hypothetical protein ACOC44_08660 [Promethearchaeia archaeon]